MLVEPLMRRLAVPLGTAQPSNQSTTNRGSASVCLWLDPRRPRRSGRVPGIAPRHPPTPPDVRFSVSGGWTRRLTCWPRDPTASQIHSAANCVSTGPDASSPAPRRTKRHDASAHSAASTRARPSAAKRGSDPARHASAAKSISVYAAESSPPAERPRAAPRPAGNIPTSRSRTAATRRVIPDSSRCGNCAKSIAPSAATARHFAAPLPAALGG